MKFILSLAALAGAANAYFLVGLSTLAIERIDPIVNPGTVSGHVHHIFGGSNTRITTSTGLLRQSQCTSVGIMEDRSAYWFPELYFQRKNGSFTSVNGGGVVYYLYSDTPGTTTPFPDDFRMISGDMFLRTYDPNSFAQQAITFLCLDFGGVSKRYNELPPTRCPSGIRAEVNFPSCWDGKNVDSTDHKSHVAFPSEGADKGTCKDPKYPKTLPRLFFELYFGTQDFDSIRDQAMNPNQPFVFAHGDPTGYGYHGDFFNGWAPGILQEVVDKCHCNPFGDPTCCDDLDLFHLNKDTNCKVTKTWDEQTTGTIPKLPGNNPVQPFGQRASVKPNDYIPPKIEPVYAYIGDKPTASGKVVGTGQVLAAPMPTNTTPPAISSSPAPSPPTQQSPSLVASSPMPTKTPEPDTNDGDSFCDAKSQYRKHQRRHQRRMHNAAFGESL